jgi:hypothetical protein
LPHLQDKVSVFVSGVRNGMVLRRDLQKSRHGRCKKTGKFTSHLRGTLCNFLHTTCKRFPFLSGTGNFRLSHWPALNICFRVSACEVPSVMSIVFFTHNLPKLSHTGLFLSSTGHFRHSHWPALKIVQYYWTMRDGKVKRDLSHRQKL